MIWTLDTCGFSNQENCQLEMTSEFQFIRFVRRCPTHEAANSEFNDVVDENKRGPGNTLYEITRNAPPGLVDTLPDGSKQFKGDVNTSWAWEGKPPNRVLKVSLKGSEVSQTVKNAIATKLNNRFGAGKVELD
jgi:hypothetical protein